MNDVPRTAADLEFGVFDWLDVSGTRDTGDVYDDRLSVLRRADAGRFTRYHLAEHHGAPLGLAPSPAVFIAAAARETSRIRLVPTTFIVPLYDPLRLTQEIGMLDRLSQGRLEIGIGKGSSPFEAAFFGFGPDDMRARYDEFVPRILDALETGVFTTSSGERVELFVTPRRVPTTWYPTSNPASIAIAAEHGQNTIFGFGFKSPPLEVVREHSDVFFEVRARLAADGVIVPGSAEPRFGMLRHVFVGETDDDAFEIATAAFHAHYESFTHLWRVKGSSGGLPDAEPDLRRLVDDHLFFVGSAESVSEQVAHAVAVSGVNYLAGAFSWGTLPVEDALRSIDLFDRVVIPNVRERLGLAVENGVAVR